MKVEIRKFKFAEFLLLLPETDIEKFALDQIKAKKISAEIKTDDAFNPYISIRLFSK